MSVVGIVERLERADVSVFDVGAVAAAVRDLDRLKGFVATLEHAVARRANMLAAAGSGAPAGEVLGRGGTCSKRQAEQISRRADTLDELPEMSRQLAKGRIGTEHADALTHIAARLDTADRDALLALDTELAQAASTSTPPQFRRFVDRIADQLAADRGLERLERQRNAMSLTTGINNDTGMYWLRAEFDPETGARLFRAIDTETTALTTQASHTSTTRVDRTRLAAQALVELATSANRSHRPGTVELLALVDLDTITTGLHDNSVCELHDGTTLPVATMRRLACDAHIIPVVLDGNGVAVDMGRSRRLATADQRRALRAMYRTCGIGNCDIAFERCEIHHLEHWGTHHGPTDLDKLIPACTHHHHLIHEGGWQLTLHPTTRELTITLPDGTIHQRSRPHTATAPTVRPTP